MLSAKGASLIVMVHLGSVESSQEAAPQATLPLLLCFPNFLCALYNSKVIYPVDSVI